MFVLSKCLSLSPPSSAVITSLKTSACLSTSSFLNSKIAVVLSGCGVFDGTEVHEAAAALAALTRAGADVTMYAPSIDQDHVVDHSKGAPADQIRNVLAEAARIARGQIKDLSELTTDAADAVVFPGGFGAAKNLSSFAAKGGEMTVIPEVEKVISGFHGAGKPQAFCCIAPILAAKVLGDKKPTLTLGSTGAAEQWPYQGAIDVAKGFGANMEEKSVSEVCKDEVNKIVTTPAYMYEGKFHEIQDGVGNMITELLKLVK